MANITSFIRWAGGKSWLVPYVDDLIQEIHFNNYFEPFMGGASVYFSLDVPGTAYLSDANSDLVNTFIQVRDRVDAVIAVLKEYKTDEASYYQIRAEEPENEVERAARFIYLNTTSFNGLYRVNKMGKYNVPYGKRVTPINYSRICSCSEKLKGAEIECQDFDDSRYLINAGDLVFLDPPYVVSREDTGFVKYNANLFSLDDQHRLSELIEYIRERDAYYIMTNAAHPMITEIFTEQDMKAPVERNSLIGGKTAYRGKVREYIFTNIPERE